MDEKLPNYVCNNCDKSVKDIQEFIKRIEKSDEYLTDLCYRSVSKPDSPFFEEYVDTGNPQSESENTEVLDPVKDETQESTIIKIGESYQCDICNKQFKYPCLLNRHKSYTHLKNQTHECNHCGKTFTNPNTLRFHKRVKHLDEAKKLIPCPHCDKSFIKPFIKNHIKRIHTERTKTKCNSCTKQFLSEYSLQRHVLREHEKVSLTTILCSICAKGFESKRDFQVHMLVHTREKPYECDYCGKTYRTSSAVEKHIQIVHFDIKPYLCDICNKSFQSSTVLKIHLRIHTGEKPFSCIACKRSFSSQSALNSHAKGIHSLKQNSKVRNKKRCNT